MSVWILREIPGTLVFAGELGMRGHEWVWYAAGSAVFAALTAILGKRGVETLPSNLATGIRTAVVLVLIAGIVIARQEWKIATGSLKGIGWLVLSGLATGASWLCYYRALQLAPASRVAPIDKLSVPLVIVLGILLLGEPVSAPVMIGGGLITAGVLVIAMS